MPKKVIPILLLMLLVIGGYIYRSEIKSFFSKDTRTINSIQKTLLIKGDLDYVRLGDILEIEGVVKDKKEVYEYMEKHDLSDEKLSPGKYLILPQTQMRDLLEGFVVDESGHGKAEKKVNVVFNRCYDIHEMARNIEVCIEADSSSIINYITSEAFLSAHGVSLEQLSALFIPDTYQMYFDTDAEAFVQNMLEIRDEFWNESRTALLGNLGLSQLQVVTLASIVYSEQSRMSEEWSTIAGLYLNRLRRGMLLQSDPTFKYCWEDRLEGVEHLTYKHRDKDCPYNTYLYPGLPPGPICLVPAKVIDAVLHAEMHDYIFMVAKPGGNGHNFSETNSQHDRFVREYKKWLKEYLRNKENN